MAEGKEYNQPRSAMYALCYASALPGLREIAREHGYCLAVHGSMHRDLDLVAVPWVEGASSPECLVSALMEAVNGQFTWQNKSFDGAPARRPHGRLSWAFYFDPVSHEEENGPYIDISVIPPIAS